MHAYREKMDFLRFLSVAVLVTACLIIQLINYSKEGASALNVVILVILLMVLGIVLTMISLAFKQIQDVRSAAAKGIGNEGVYYTDDLYLKPKPMQKGAPGHIPPSAGNKPLYDQVDNMVVNILSKEEHIYDNPKEL
ncbi:hypothetical protein SK128_014923 [Halocaridina rubra]|uniref:Uncharacterized protein n=1 Tax=Halocaridina rubra TaxID=373956 RepID=A0AAN8XEH4_HALRR